MGAAIPINLILEIILILLKKLSPSDLDKINAEIAGIREERKGKHEKFKLALAQGDVAALNELMAELMDGGV
jgi:hypothetical protein